MVSLGRFIASLMIVNLSPCDARLSFSSFFSGIKNLKMEDKLLEEASKASEPISPSPTEVPEVLSDLALLGIGVAWIIVCFLIFHFIKVCSRPKKEKDNDEAPLTYK